MPTCFVVQGFGQKTDYETGRKLDLDASYAVIREAVVEAGLDCLRADEIVHSGTIDQPMYEQLMRADLVIADLSTSNINAAFELGVRYGLRPYATIIVAEQEFKQAFDVSHSVIRRYEHLGKDIGRQEAIRFKKALTSAITEIVAGKHPDSPVYTFLQHLVPPREGALIAKAAAATVKALDSLAEVPDAASRGGPPEAGGTLKLLMEQAQTSINASNFNAARELLKIVLAQGSPRPDDPVDPFVVQQLALATYKAKEPTPLKALLDAHAVLQRLDPTTTNDPETLGLWGAVHKRLWDLRNDPAAPPQAQAALSESIAAYTRGFYLKQDYYNGVYLAFLLELRGLEHARSGNRDDAIADRVLARRTREEVVRYAEPRVASLAKLASTPHNDEERYWLTASLWETAAGLGRVDEAVRWESEARAMRPADWMLESTEGQVAKLHAQQAALAATLAAPPAAAKAAS